MILSRSPGSLVVFPDEPDGLIRVLLALGGQDRVAMADLLADPEFDDRNISKNPTISLLALAPFYVYVDQRVTDIAMDIGVLDQNPADRRYRLARRWGG